MDDRQPTLHESLARLGDALRELRKAAGIDWLLDRPRLAMAVIFVCGVVTLGLIIGSAIWSGTK